MDDKGRPSPERPKVRNDGLRLGLPARGGGLLGDLGPLGGAEGRGARLASLEAAQTPKGDGGRILGGRGLSARGESGNAGRDLIEVAALDT